MRDNSIYEDLSLIHKRAQAVFIVIAVLFAAAASFYWKIQILDYRKYWSMSEANRTREVVLPAPRAILTDRGGTSVLADNRASFKASFIRENVRDLEASIREIAALLELEESVLRERIDKYRSLPVFRPITVKDNLSLEEVSRVEGRKLDLPELIIEAEPRRRYPFGTLAAHVLGYLQEVTPEELRETSTNRRLGDMVGKTGLEATYEKRLAGIDGTLTEVVDSQGRKQEELQRIEPRSMPKLLLTIDMDLQEKAEELLAGKEGAIVALDPATGEVLALASSPTYDPNKFINRFTPEEWQGLVENPDFPLLNRAIQAQYSPGSIFKPVLALAGLDTGAITAETMFSCSGTAVFYDRPFRCWFEGGHGSLALADAIKNSCNIYFYNVGRRLGVDAIARYSEMLGLGAKTGIEIPGEKKGLVPSTAWKKKTFNLPWYPGETISVAIGQGPIRLTPLQAAVMTAIIANRGARVRPRLTAEAIEPPLPAGSLTLIPAETFEKIVEGMWRSVNDGGTGQEARVEGFNICGKTGSTQTISRETAERLGPRGQQVKTHSWFTGFAPRDKPRLVVTVLVEFGGMGGATAAPAAGQLFSLFKARND